MAGFGFIRAWTRGMLPEFIRVGMGSNAVERAVFKEFGTGYRRSVMQADYREFSGLLKKESLIRGLEPTEQAPGYMMVEHDLRRHANYRDIGTVRVRDIETGEEYERTVSMYHDPNYTQDEMDFMFAGMFQDEKYIDKEEFLSYTRKSLEHNRGYGY